MPNSVLTEKVRNSIIEIYRDFNYVTSNIDHNGLKGAFRELSIGDLIEKYLPKNYSIGKGVIIDSDGNQSGEVDLIIYDNNDIRPVLYSELEGMFPIECCRYVFEIKSKSTATEIQTTVSKFKKIRQMKSINGFIPNLTYYAYSTDLIEEDELKRFSKYDDSFKSKSVLDTMCVTNKGYWYRKEFWADGILINQRFQRKLSDGNYLENLLFISGIINTLNTRTCIGFYILPDDYMEHAHLYFHKYDIEITIENSEYYRQYRLASKHNDFLNELKFLNMAIPSKEKFIQFVRSIIEESSNDGTNRSQYYNKYLSSIL